MGREHPSTANSLDALDELMLDRGDVDAADPLFREGLAIRRVLFEEDHTDFATGLTRLAGVRLWKGDHAGADTLLRQALPVFRRSFGEDSPDVADVLELLGAACVVAGELGSADPLFAQAMAIWRSKPITPTHDGPTGLLVRMGALRLRQGQLDEARSTLSMALAVAAPHFWNGTGGLQRRRACSVHASPGSVGSTRPSRS